MVTESQARLRERVRALERELRFVRREQLSEKGYGVKQGHRLKELEDWRHTVEQAVAMQKGRDEVEDKHARETADQAKQEALSARSRADEAHDGMDAAALKANSADERARRTTTWGTVAAAILLVLQMLQYQILNHAPAPQPAPVQVEQPATVNEGGE